MKTILAATDFSSNATCAAHRSALMARSHGSARVVLLHVLRPDRPLKQWLGRSPTISTRLERARVQLDALAGALRSVADIEIEIRIAVGKSVADAVETAAKSADVLVVGAPARRPVGKVIARSTVRRLIRDVQGPLLIVRRPALSPYRRAIVAVDFGTPSFKAIETARSMAPAARLEVVHAYTAPFEGKLQYAGASAGAIANNRVAALERATFRMADLMLSQPRVPALAVQIVHGHPTVALLAKERERNSDLVVVSRRTQPPVVARLVQSVTFQMLEDGKADLLVVPV